MSKSAYKRSGPLAPKRAAKRHDDESGRLTKYELLLLALAISRKWAETFEPPKRRSPRRELR